MLKEVVICEYDSAWVQGFQEEKDKIVLLLKAEEVIGIEHFGSTSVPGLPAKPIIDILRKLVCHVGDYFSRKLLIHIMCISSNMARKIGRNH